MESQQSSEGGAQAMSACEDLEINFDPLGILLADLEALPSEEYTPPPGKKKKRGGNGGDGKANNVVAPITMPDVCMNNSKCRDWMTEELLFVAMQFANTTNRLDDTQAHNLCLNVPQYLRLYNIVQTVMTQKRPQRLKTHSQARAKIQKLEHELESTKADVTRMKFKLHVDKISADVHKDLETEELKSQLKEAQALLEQEKTVNAGLESHVALLDKAVAELRAQLKLMESDLKTAKIQGKATTNSVVRLRRKSDLQCMAEMGGLLMEHGLLPAKFQTMLSMWRSALDKKPNLSIPASPCSSTRDSGCPSEANKLGSPAPVLDSDSDNEESFLSVPPATLPLSVSPALNTCDGETAKTLPQGNIQQITSPKPGQSVDDVIEKSKGKVKLNSLSLCDRDRKSSTSLSKQKPGPLTHSAAARSIFDLSDQNKQSSTNKTLSAMSTEDNQDSGSTRDPKVAPTNQSKQPCTTRRRYSRDTACNVPRNDNIDAAKAGQLLEQALLDESEITEASDVFSPDSMPELDFVSQNNDEVCADTELSETPEPKKIQCCTRKTASGAKNKTENMAVAAQLLEQALLDQMRNESESSALDPLSCNSMPALNLVSQDQDSAWAELERTQLKSQIDAVNEKKRKSPVKVSDRCKKSTKLFISSYISGSRSKIVNNYLSTQTESVVVCPSNIILGSVEMTPPLTPASPPVPSPNSSESPLSLPDTNEGLEEKLEATSEYLASTLDSDEALIQCIFSEMLPDERLSCLLSNIVQDFDLDVFSEEIVTAPSSSLSNEPGVTCHDSVPVCNKQPDSAALLCDVDKDKIEISTSAQVTDCMSEPVMETFKNSEPRVLRSRSKACVTPRKEQPSHSNPPSELHAIFSSDMSPESTKRVLRSGSKKSISPDVSKNTTLPELSSNTGSKIPDSDVRTLQSQCKTPAKAASESTDVITSPSPNSVTKGASRILRSQTKIPSTPTFNSTSHETQPDMAKITKPNSSVICPIQKTRRLRSQSKQSFVDSVSSCVSDNLDSRMPKVQSKRNITTQPSACTTSIATVKENPINTSSASEARILRKQTKISPKGSAKEQVCNTTNSGSDKRILRSQSRLSYTSHASTSTCSQENDKEVAMDCSNGSNDQKGRKVRRKSLRGGSECEPENERAETSPRASTPPVPTSAPTKPTSETDLVLEDINFDLFLLAPLCPRPLLSPFGYSPPPHAQNNNEKELQVPAKVRRKISLSEPGVGAPDKNANVEQEKDKGLDKVAIHVAENRLKQGQKSSRIRKSKLLISELFGDSDSEGDETLKESESLLRAVNHDHGFYLPPVNLSSPHKNTKL